MVSVWATETRWDTVKAELWCTIQAMHETDSIAKEDWTREASSMGLVYSHAACTISATASADSIRGCFYPRRAPPSLGISVLRRHKYGKCLVARSTRHSQQASLDTVFNEYVDRAPIITRGWCFQERLLSSRMLHYCNGHVLFECNTMRASESNPKGMIYREKRNLRADGAIVQPRDLESLLTEDNPHVQVRRHVPAHTAPSPAGMLVTRYPAQEHMMRESNPHYMSRPQKEKEFLAKAALMGLRGEFQVLLAMQTRTTTHWADISLWERLEFHKAWYAVVSSFSARKLTCPSDRLPAVLGIAERIHSACPATLLPTEFSRAFVAGLWSKNVLLDLLWKRCEGAEVMDRRIEGAPTWSWTSTSAYIETALAHLSTSVVGTSTENLEILIQGEHEVKILEQGFDGISKARLRLSVLVSDMNAPRGEDFTADDPNFAIDEYDKFVWVPVLKCVSAKGGPDDISTIHGLVAGTKAKANVELSENTFERVGYESREGSVHDYAVYKMAFILV